MSFDPVSYLLGQQAGGGGGGVNPNYTEMIEGTLADPFGNYDVMSLLQNEEPYTGFTMTLVLLHEDEPPILLLPSFLQEENAILFSTVASIGETIEEWAVVAAAYIFNQTGMTGSIMYSVAEGQTVDLRSIADSTQTILVVFHHPMPSEGGDGA